MRVLKKVSVIILLLLSSYASAADVEKPLNVIRLIEPSLLDFRSLERAHGFADVAHMKLQTETKPADQSLTREFISPCWALSLIPAPQLDRLSSRASAVLQRIDPERPIVVLTQRPALPAVTATFTAVALIALAAGSARANPLPDTGDTAEEEVPLALPCRPTIACTAEMVPEGTLEIETGWLRRIRRDARGLDATPVLLKLSLTDRLQLQAGTNGLVFGEGGNVRYLDDIVVGTKVLLLPQSSLAPALSLSGALSIPMFRGQPGYVRTWDVISTLYVTKDFPWSLHADLNLGLALWRLEYKPLVQQELALAISRPIFKGLPFTAMVEVYGFTDASPIAPRDAGILVGLSWTVRRSLVLDAGGDLELSRTQSASLFAGLTWTPGQLWQPHTSNHSRPSQTASR